MAQETFLFRVKKAEELSLEVYKRWVKKGRKFLSVFASSLELDDPEFTGFLIERARNSVMSYAIPMFFDKVGFSPPPSILRRVAREVDEFVEKSYPLDRFFFLVVYNVLLKFLRERKVEVPGVEPAKGSRDELLGEVEEMVVENVMGPCSAFRVVFDNAGVFCVMRFCREVESFEELFSKAWDVLQLEKPHVAWFASYCEGAFSLRKRNVDEFLRDAKKARRFVDISRAFLRVVLRRMLQSAVLGNRNLCSFVKLYVAEML